MPRVVIVLLTVGIPAVALAKAPVASSARTKGVTAVAERFERADGDYNADGTAALLHRPDFIDKSLAYSSKGAGALLDSTARGRLAERIARSFLRARHDDLGLDADAAAALVHTGTLAMERLAVVRFTQRLAGLPVYGSDLAISVGYDGSVVFVASDLVHGLRPVGVSAAARPGAALAAARAYLGAARRFETGQRMAYRDGSGATRLVTRVLADSWELLVDDASGEVVRAEDKAAYADGRGKPYRPDPLQKTKAQYGDPGFVDGGGADTAELTAARYGVALRDVNGTSAGRFDLVGPWAACQDNEAPFDAACPDRANNRFLYKRSNRFFDAVNAYYHLDKYMRYVNQTLAVPARPSYAGGVKYDPHGFSGADNSHFVSSQGGYLAFGQGGVDDAEDADVVVHELGHGLHYWATGGNLSQVEGLSEGVGDYAAAGYSRDEPRPWPASAAEYHWVFSWDGHNPFWPGRVTNWNTNHTYPNNIGTGIHEQGQYWASCNLIARKAIGAQVMDKAFWTGLAMTNGSTNQKQAAQAVINAANTLGYTTAQKNAILSAYNTSCTYNVTAP